MKLFRVNIFDDFNFDVMKNQFNLVHRGHCKKVESATRAVIVVRNSRLLLIDKFARHVPSELNYNRPGCTSIMITVFGRFVAKFCSSIIS